MSIDLFGKAHESADTDAERDAIHHTLGSGPNQAAQGNHNHDADYIDPTELSTALLAYYLKTDADAKFLTGQNLLTTITATLLPNDATFPVGTSIFTSSSAATGWPNTNGVGLVIKASSVGTRTFQIFIDTTNNVWFRVSTSATTWSAWTQVNDTDTGWITTGLVQSALAPAEAPFLGGVVTLQKLRVLNNVVEFRFSMTPTAVAYTANASGNYTNLNVATGLPSQYRPSNNAELRARWNDVPMSAVLDTTGAIVLVGGPPNVAIPASAAFTCSGFWFLG